MNEGESGGVELQLMPSDVSKVHVVGEFERVKVDHRVLPEAMILVFFEISSPWDFSGFTHRTNYIAK